MEKAPEEVTSRKRYAKGLSLVTIVNIVSFVVGVAASLLVPDALSLGDYAIFKTYNLYATYVGFFHFGFIDGIYLLYSGLVYDKIDKPKFRTFFWFFFVMEMVTGLLAAGICFFTIHDPTLLIVLLLVIATMLATNVTNYYGIIAQLTTDFRNYSLKNLVRCVVKGLSLVLLLVFWKANILSDYLVYVYILTGLILADLVVDLDYMLTFKSATFGKCAPLKECWPDISKIFIVGFPLLIANICLSIIYSLNSQIVQLGYPDEIFAYYSFAHSILSIVTTITSGISTLIFPMLRQVGKEKIRDHYESLLTKIVFLGAFMFNIYFFSIWGVNWLLPKYNPSIPTLAIVMPIAVIYSIINLILHSYFKALDINNHFVVIALAFLGLAAGAEIGVYYATKNIDLVTTTQVIDGVETTLSYSPTSLNAISYTAVAVFYLWVIFLMAYLAKKEKLPFWRNAILITVSTAAYYGIVAFNVAWYKGFLLFTALLGLVYLVHRAFPYKKLSAPVAQ
jgi:O-antigen/teichoic acid export membrane protein